MQTRDEERPDTVEIPRRFCGPPESANGGYACGLLASRLPGPVECTLRKPIPLERRLTAVVRGDEAELRDGETVVMTARRTALNLQVPPTVSFEVARAASERSPALVRHPFPTCLVCGPERAASGGLCIFPGVLSGDAIAALRPWPGDVLYAAPWTPASSLAGPDGATVDPPFVWAAMDCPTGFAAGFASEGTLVTGRLAVERRAPVRVEEPAVLLSWPLGWDGRKSHAAAVLYQGNLVRAVARATWVRIG